MRKLLILLFPVIFQNILSSAQTITTIAGTGTNTPSNFGNGGPATSATIDYPTHIIWDASNNLYFGDFDNKVIRMINPSGVIISIAGNGINSYSGDGGPATSAANSGAAALAFDAVGNLYFSDYYNFRIRKINTSGIISTIAGNGTTGYNGDGIPATNARITNPWGVVIDGTGNIYIADRYNHRIRKINTSGIITTIAGNGTAGFGGDGGPATNAALREPVDLAFDLSGNLFFTDFYYSRIRKISPSGIITTVGGNGINGFGGDGGPATSASMFNPTGVSIDGAGNIYISDYGNNRIRKINTSGIISTIAGTGIAGYNGDGIPATSAQLKTPYDVKIRNTQDIYICDAFNYRIRMIKYLNSTPAFTGGSMQSILVCMNGIASINSLLTINDLDFGQPLTWNALLGPSHGTVVSSYTTTSTGGTIMPIGLNYTPTPGYSGSDAFTIIVSDGTASDTTTINVTINPLPNDINGVLSVCIGNTTTLTNATVGGIWSSGSSIIATVNSTSGIVSGVSTGVSIITYTTGSGCFDTAQITVNASPGLISGPTAICVGTSTQLSNSTSGGTWASSNTSVASINSSGAGSGTIYGVSSGMSVITYTLPSGCSVTTTITINPSPSTISGITQVCAGYSTTLSNTISGGTWSTGSPGLGTVTIGGVVWGVASGSALISYTTGTGCFVTASVTVNTTPAPISGAHTACLGTTTHLSNTTSGGAWSSSNTAIATIVATGAGQGAMSASSIGTSTISYILPSGCAATVSITVTPSPTAIAGNTQVCSGATAVLSNGISGGTWSSGSSAIATINAANGLVSGTTAGTAVISYAISSCIVTSSITVRQTPVLYTSIPNICIDGTATLSSAPGGGTWASSNTSVATIMPTGVNTALVSGITQGGAIITYSLLGCSKTTTLSAFAALPDIAGNTFVCTGNTISLSNSIGGGTWSSSSSAVTINTTSGLVTGNVTGDAVITYSIGGSCTTTTTVTIHQTPDAGTITGRSDLCVGDTIVLTSTISGGIWNSSNTSVIVANGIVTGMAPDTTTLLYIITNGWCADTAVSIIHTYAVPDAGTIVGPSSVCIGAAIILSNTATGGTWHSALTSVATISTTGRVTGASAGTDTISYIMSNPGCSSAAIHTITVNSVPVAGLITGPEIICKGVAFILSNAVTGGIWTSNNISVATINSSTGDGYATNTGVALITYTAGPNAAGCYGQAVFTLTVTAVSFSVNSVIAQIKCRGDNNGSITVSVNGSTGPMQYIWSNDSTSSTISGLPPGMYTLNILELSTQCSVSDTFNIAEPDSLHVTAQTVMDKCNTGAASIITTVTGGRYPYSWLWSNNTTAAELQDVHKGTYSVSVTDMSGCVKDLSFIIIDTCGDLMIHDAITPNGDGVNDKWIIQGIEAYPGNTVSLFDKWGDAVYEKTDYANDWSGSSKNGRLPDGTYFYMVKLPATGTKGENILTGTLIIKR